MDSNKKKGYKSSTIVLFIVVCIVFVSAICFTFLYVRDYRVNDAIDISRINEDKHINIYFVRHGKTDANANNIYAGSGTDAKLTTEGINSTKKTGDALKSISFDKVYTSELSRTIDTANIILEENNNGLPRLEAMNLLNDINWGDIEGKPQAEVAKMFPQYDEEFLVGNVNDKSFNSPVYAPNKNKMVNQFYKALKEICKNSPDGANVLVVGHSSFVWLLDSLFPEQMKGIEGLNNSSITLLEYDKGNLTLKQVNMDADNYSVN